MRLNCFRQLRVSHSEEHGSIVTPKIQDSSAQGFTVQRSRKARKATATCILTLQSTMQTYLRLFLLALFLLSSGSGGGFSSAATVRPQFSRVFIVVEENASYSQVIGNPVMPYLNS